MEIGVVRNSYESAAGYTHARLFVDEGGFLCWTLEPEDRGLHQDMPLTQIQARKVKGKTAIPSGHYRVKLLVSQKFKDRDYAKPYGGRFPTIMNVPGFSGILIHPGNTPADTSGCILPGMLQGSIRGQVFDSVKAYRDLMDFYIWPAYQRGEEIWINIY